MFVAAAGDAEREQVPHAAGPGRDSALIAKLVALMNRL